MLIRKAFLAAAVVCLGALAGCVNFQVDEHSYQFNEATGSLNLRLLLLNAVRASKDYPLQFSKIQAYQGTGTSSASDGPHRFIPYVYDPERGEKYALLLVKRGIPPPGGAAVSVVSPDGETFYVPRRDHDAPKADLSLEALSIVTEVLNSAVSKKAFPAVTTLTVRSD